MKITSLLFLLSKLKSLRHFWVLLLVGFAPLIRAQPATNCAARPPGLIAWWPGDGFTIDVAGTNNGSLQNGAGFTNGLAGQAFNFDGVNDSVQVLDSDQWAFGTNDFTIELWARFASTSGSVALLANDTGSGNLNKWIFWRDGGFLRFHINGTPGSVNIGTGVFTPVVGNWYHVAVTRNSSNYIFYTNGIALSTNVDSRGVSNANAPLTIGSAENNFFFNGQLDEPSIYTRALSSSEIAAIHAASNAGKCYTNNAAPVFVVQPVGQVAIEQRNASFSGGALGTPRPNFQWLFNGSPLTNATNSNLLLTNLAPNQGGSYALMATNLSGKTTSAVAQLTVLVDYNLTNRVATNCLPRPFGLISWWPGDGAAIDVANTNHGVLQNDSGFATGKAGLAFNFDGADDYVRLPNNLFPFPTIGTSNAPFSFELWFRTTNSGVILGQTIADPFQSSAGHVPSIYVGIDGILRVEMFWKGVVDQIATTNIVNNGAFHHLAVAYDGNNETVWLDATTVGSKSFIQQSYATVYHYQLGMGYAGAGWPGGNGGWFPFRGSIDEPALYSRALTTDEVSALYAVGNGGKCYTNDPGPVFLVHPQSQTGFLANSVSLNGVAMGSPRPTFQWLFNSNALAGATNNFLLLSNLVPSNAGSYSLIASNASGVVTSTPANLVVQAPLFLTGVDGFELFGGWTIQGTQWEVGIPTSGPGSAHSGSNCAATVLGGNYADNSSGLLASPAFVVPSVNQNPRLRFWHWYYFSLYGEGSDFGEVQIKAGTNEWAPLVRYSGYSGGAWAYANVDLSAYANQTVQLGFFFSSVDVGGNGAVDVGPGWYIDELQIRTGPEIFNNPEFFETSWGDWDTDNYALWQIGIPTSGPAVNTNTGSRAYSPISCAATLLNANYAVNSQGRLISPRFIVPSVSGDDRVIIRFWHYYQYGTGDAGLVQISTPYDTNWNTLAVAATNGTLGAWTLATVDLTQFQGQEVRLGFYHTANSDGSVGAGWFIDDVSLSQSTPTRLTINTLFPEQFSTNRQNQYFVVNAPSGGHLRISLADLDHLGITEIYVRRGALPTAGTFDYRFSTSGTNQSVLAPNAGAGDWFILAYNDSGPLPGDYTLRVDFTVGVILDSIAPALVGNSVPSSVTINGAGFEPSDAVALVNGVNVYPASNVFFVSASKLIVDFNFPTIPTNSYLLRVTGSTNSDSLPFQLIAGVGPKLDTKIHVPSRVGYHGVATIYVEYSNTGDAPLPAPLLTVSAEQLGRQGALLTLDASRLIGGFWTAAVPDGFAHSVQFVGNGATPGLLQPGESRTVPVYYAGWQQPWDIPGYHTIFFNLGVLASTNSTPIDWPLLKADMRPSTVSTEAWDIIFANLTNQIGNTWGDYVRTLDANANYLAKLGENVSDIRDLLSFEVRQASGLGIFRTCASAIDAQVIAPGPALIFRRSFSTDIADHYRLGRLGRGWSDNWDISLTVTNDTFDSTPGTVTILGPGRSRRVFQPDMRKPTFFTQAGDNASLTNLGTGRYLLRETDGTKYAFRSDGKLDYLEDTHGTRITASYSGNHLDRLTHSTGPFLQFGYNGERISLVTDSLGRTNNFIYDGSAEHLRFSVNYRSQTNEYSYSIGLGAAREHALTTVVNPDGTTQNYTYDNAGHLATRAGCCGAIEQVTYTYDSAGKVTITDALTNTTKNYFDHRGLLVRTEDPLNRVTQRTYDANGYLIQITDAAGRTRAFTYDARGNRISDTDQLGYTTRFVFTEDLNRLATLIDAKGNVTRYSYESDGDLNAITYADNSVERWSYDAAGTRLSWTNRRSQPIYYTNDLGGRVLTRRYPDGSLVTFRYDARGNLTNFTDATGSTTQEFDANDRLRRIIYPGNRILGYTYDSGERRMSMTNELGHRTEYHYDTRGRLEYLTDETSAEIVRYRYNAVGALTNKFLGNGVFTTYEYDRANQLTNLSNFKSNGVILSRFAYSYDERGRRKTMTTTYGPGDPRQSIAGLWRYD